MRRQHHIAGVVCDNGVWVSCDIVEELVDILHCVLSEGGLLHGEGPDCGDHCDIDGARVVEEDSYYLLDEFLVSLGEEG